MRLTVAYGRMAVMASGKPLGRGRQRSAFGYAVRRNGHSAPLF